MNGKLFSQDFLLDGICGTPVWEGLPNVALDTFLDGLKRIYAPLTANSPLNEANTEADIIEQVLGLLGWGDLTLRQVTASSSRREDVPDFLLFPDEAAKLAGRAERRDDRRYRTARLDALFFHLYGLSRDAAAYILDTFPIVREHDEKAHGRYLTKELVLAYMNAVAAGDLETVIHV